MRLHVLTLIWMAVVYCQVNQQTENIDDNDADGNDALSDQSILEDIKSEFKFIWSNYEATNLYGKDEIKPVTGGYNENALGGWGVTLVDSLSTLYVMGMKDEFQRAVEFVKKLDFTKGTTATSFFEVTIRYLAGLISAYDLSQDRGILAKAIELADVLLLDFNSPSGYPYTTFDFTTNTPDTSDPNASLANIGSCQLEFTRLSIITGDPKYKEAALKVYDILDTVKSGPGLYYANTDVVTGKFTSKSLTFGALGDSFFEYLIKLYIMLGPKDNSRKKYLRMFEESMVPLNNSLIVPCGSQTCMGYTNERGIFQPYTQHLHFFISGMLLLGSDHLPQQQLDKLAYSLLETFSTALTITKTGLAPELIQFDTNGISVGSSYNALRPELAESLFYAYRYTDDQKYRQRAYKLFEAFKMYSRSNYGYAEYEDVDNSNKTSMQRDSMPSFLLAETFKYLYLTFTPKTTLPLDEWVFNTEAHPFRISK